MADVAVVTDLVAKDSASREVDSVTRSLKGLDQAAGEAGRGGLSNFANALGVGAGIALTTQAINLMADAVKTAGGVIFGFSADLEQAQVSFKNLLQNGEQAKAFMQELQAFATATPFEFPQVVKGAQNLLSAGFAARDVIPMLTDLGNVMAAMGKDSSQVERVSLVFNQMRNTGRVLGGDLLQLSQAGVSVGRVFEMMSEISGKSVSELKALEEQGALSTDLFFEAFHRFASLPQFAHAMEEQARTWKGAWSAISDAARNVGATAFEPIFRRITDLAVQISQFVQTDAFAEWGAKVAAGLDVALDAVGNLAGAFGSGLSAVWDVVTTVGMQIYEALSWLNPFATHSPSLVSQVADGVGAILEYYQQLGGATPDIMANAAAIRDYSGSLAATKENVKLLRDEQESAKQSVDRIASALSAAKSELQKYLEAPVQGSRAFEQRLFGIDQAVARNQKVINDAVRARLGGQDIDFNAVVEAKKQIRELNLEAEGVKLDEKLQLGPLRQQIKDAGKSTQELSVDAILNGIAGAKKNISELEPALKNATLLYDAQKESLGGLEKKLEEVIAKQKENMNLPKAGDPLAGADFSEGQRKLDEFKEKMKGFREEFEKSPLLQATKDLAENLRHTHEGLDAVGGAIGRITQPFRDLFAAVKDAGVFDSFGRSFDNIKQTFLILEAPFNSVKDALSKMGVDVPKANPAFSLLALTFKQWADNLELVTSSIKELMRFFDAIARNPLAQKGFDLALGQVGLDEKGRKQLGDAIKWISENTTDAATAAANTPTNPTADNPLNPIVNAARNALGTDTPQQPQSAATALTTPGSGTATTYDVIEAARNRRGVNGTEPVRAEVKARVAVEGALAKLFDGDWLNQQFENLMNGALNAMLDGSTGEPSNSGMLGATP